MNIPTAITVVSMALGGLTMIPQPTTIDVVTPPRVTTTTQAKTETKQAKTKKNKKKKKKHKKKKEKYKMLEVTITGYCPCNSCSEGYGHRTCTGAYATEGRTIAVDKSIIPYGTEVEIDGHRYVAEDCGGGVNGYHIDVFVENHSDTYNWSGTKKVKVFYK